MRSLRPAHRIVRRVTRETFAWIRSSLPAIAFLVAFRIGVVDAYHVPTGSMRPTILEGDRFLAAKFAYKVAEPQRGEIAVFSPPEHARVWIGQDTSRMIKRIVAVEGDVVAVAGGALFVNGVVVEEPYLAAPPTYTLAPRRVPADHVFVLGDNRDNSADGHLWGFLPKSRLKAKVFARYWPPARIGAIG